MEVKDQRIPDFLSSLNHCERKRPILFHTLDRLTSKLPTRYPIPMPEDQLSAAFLNTSARKLSDSVTTLSRCFDRLTDEQIWARGGPHENAIGNLVLHLCGNMRQWILHGVAGAPDVRTRPLEFSTTGGYTRHELLSLYQTNIAEVASTIVAVPAARLSEIIHPQQRTVTVLEAIYQVVVHVQLHMGQIILLTKQLAATDLDLTIPRPR